MGSETMNGFEKAMELLPYGPIALTDTAGLGDATGLGAKRVQKTEKILDKTDFAIYAADSTAFDPDAYTRVAAEFDKRKIGHMLVFTKSDTATPEFAGKYPDHPQEAAHAVLHDHRKARSPGGYPAFFRRSFPL